MYTKKIMFVKAETCAYCAVRYLSDYCENLSKNNREFSEAVLESYLSLHT